MNTEINQFNYTKIINNYKNILTNNTYWHQILIENVEGLDRGSVLKTIMRSCKPAHFIPVQYVSYKNRATFLLKNCGPAIEKLCNQNLIIINPYNNDKPFKISLNLCYALGSELKINIQLNITRVLDRRLILQTGVLNLDNFAEDAELEEYCTLSQPKLLFYVMQLVKNISFKTLILSNNDIDTLHPMEALKGVKNYITLDLRNNCIKEVSELDCFKHLNVRELWLDGNPICDNYCEVTYGKSIKDHAQKLKKLDGITIKSKPFLPFRRNFLCNFSGYDLVDQFLEHYFTLYDTNNRSILGEMYHRDAIFSLTTTYIPLQATSSTTQLTPYEIVSRNLKQMSDFSKNTLGLFIGPYPIVKVLNSLPSTEHDSYSFTTDLITYTDKIAVLVVSGVFRECSEPLMESNPVLGFTRTFVLLAGKNCEYSIINEMLNVTNATMKQTLRAFKHSKIAKVQCLNLPRAQNDKELQDMTDALKAITGLKTDWARKCLEECNRDLKDALTLFIELLQKNKLPKSAFLSEEKTNKTLTKQSVAVDKPVELLQSINDPVYTLSPINNTTAAYQSTSTSLKANPVVESTPFTDVPSFFDHSKRLIELLKKQALLSPPTLVTASANVSFMPKRKSKKRGKHKVTLR